MVRRFLAYRAAKERYNRAVQQVQVEVGRGQVRQCVRPEPGARLQHNVADIMASKSNAFLWPLNEINEYSPYLNYAWHGSSRFFQ